MAKITFIRHAETVANATGVWTGRFDGPLSEHGESTLGPLGERLGEQPFDVVISSPLQRARLTAEAFADELILDERFLEIDLGRWEGWSREKVIAEDGELLSQAVHQRNVPMGATGETLDQAGERVLTAVDALAEELGEEGHAAVVTHGGLLQNVLHRHLAGRVRRMHGFTQNTGINRIEWHWGHPRLATFNDVGHLGAESGLVRQYLADAVPVLALIRHGRTRANVERRWQGRGDWGLDDVGESQARALADWYGTRSVVFTSPLERARATAAQIAMNGVEKVEDLREISMGEWEGLTTEEIVDGWPALIETIYRDGVDLRRGESGESFAELRARVTRAINSLELSTSETSVVVSHGGAIRSYISGLTKNDDSHAESLLTPVNTSVTHVALTDRGPELLDYAVATHLEGLPRTSYSASEPAPAPGVPISGR
jgi:broad specificity phosphatase PhoE